MRILVGALLSMLLATRPAKACGVPDFGQILGDVATSLAGTRAPVERPLLIVGLGTSSEGSDLSFTFGYGWGERQFGGMFPGTDLTRVLASVRRSADDTSLALTYGWFGYGILDAGFDFGLESRVTNGFTLGPAARVTVGSGGVGVRLSGAFQFGDQIVRGSGAAELVVDFMKLVGTI